MLSFCEVRQKYLCDDEDCATCLEKSFVSHERAVYLDNWAKARYILMRSSKKLWFNCNCGHRFKSSPRKINEGHWCPFCSKGGKLCDDDDCEMCLAGSFASHERAIYFDEAANGISPRRLRLYSNLKFWFNCDCGHAFRSKLSAIVGNNSWCPYCSKRGITLCDDGECMKCYKKSLASVGAYRLYDFKKNKLSPRRVHLRTRSKSFWFKCEKCGAPTKLVPVHIGKHIYCQDCDE